MITNEDISLLVELLNDRLRGDVKDEHIEKLAKKLDIINKLNQAQKEANESMSKLRKELDELSK